MKKQNLTSLLFYFILPICFLYVSNPVTAQNLCVEIPTTAAEFMECNRNIASTFAPVIVQYVSTDSYYAAGGNADRIVPYNFDGDWNGFNNWENVYTAAPPTVYYNVHWSESFWTITYTLYWARD